MHIFLIGGTEEERIRLAMTLASEDTGSMVSSFSWVREAAALLAKQDSIVLPGQRDPATVIARPEPTLILLDGDSQIVDWVDGYRRLHTMVPNARIVLLSRDHGRAVKAYEEGMWDYILKPVKPQQLRRVLNKAAALDRIQTGSAIESIAR